MQYLLTTSIHHIVQKGLKWPKMTFVMVKFSTKGERGHPYNPPPKSASALVISKDVTV